MDLMGTMTTDPLLSILMVAYNSKKYLDGCLNAIKESVSCPFEVVLVDNASPEPVLDDLTLRYSWLRIIRSSRNLGFNAGNNLAAKNARGKYILLLNIDTLLLTDVEPAVRLLEADQNIAVVGARACGGSGELRPSAGHFPKARRLWWFRSLWTKPTVSYGPSEWHAFRVDWVEGSFLMTRLENWIEIGGFDENNFLYGNDVDFCRGTADRGLAVVQCTDVRYVHFGGYEMSRARNLYAGFREYHRKFSNPLERLNADVVLWLGLLARISVYGLWYRLTKNDRIGRKLQSFVQVHRDWPRITP
jgi:GT2 family glycosyltransferase